MAKFTPEYDRITCTNTFSTCAITAADDSSTIGATFRGLVHSMLVTTHTWDVVDGGASGCSGAYVEIIDDSSRELYQTAELLTGTTTLMSADVMLIGNHTVRYKMCDGNNDERCVSGGATPIAQFNNPTVVLYVY